MSHATDHNRSSEQPVKTERETSQTRRGGRQKREAEALIEIGMRTIVDCRDRQTDLSAAQADLRIAEREARLAQRHINEAERRICGICSSDEDAIRAIRRANQAVCEHAA